MEQPGKKSKWDENDPWIANLILSCCAVFKTKHLHKIVYQIMGGLCVSASGGALDLHRWFLEKIPWGFFLWNSIHWPNLLKELVKLWFILRNLKWHLPEHSLHAGAMECVSICHIPSSFCQALKGMENLPLSGLSCEFCLLSSSLTETALLFSMHMVITAQCWCVVFWY